MSTGNRIHHINLMVDDLARAIDFYGTALGLDRSRRDGVPLNSSRSTTYNPHQPIDDSTPGLPFYLRVDDSSSFRRIGRSER